MSSSNLLAVKLARLMSDLPAAEAEHLKTILSLAAGGIEFGNQTGEDPHQCVPSLETIAKSLHSEGVVPTYWRGRPAFLSDALLTRLASEADSICSQAHRNNHCWLLAPGAQAMRFAKLDTFKSFISQFSSSLTLSLAMYTYYREPGDRLDLHLDDPNARLTASLMLRHKRPDDLPGSRLVLVKPDATLDHCQLAEGEMLVFEGSRTLHGREPLRIGEYVALLTFLFKSSS